MPEPAPGFPIPKEVFAAAYESTGLWPQSGIWLRFRRFGLHGPQVECGCPIGTLLAANGLRDEAKTAASEYDIEAAMLELLEGVGYVITRDQFGSFITGVDFGASTYASYTHIPACYNDGVAVREEVMKPILARLKGEATNG